MGTNVRELRDDMLKAIASHKGYLDFCSKNNDDRVRRFWNRFRTDLQVMKSEEVKGWLQTHTWLNSEAKKDESKPEEKELRPDFGKCLAETFAQKEPDIFHQALILVCLEMDARYRLQSSKCGQKARLGTLLRLGDAK